MFSLFHHSISEHPPALCFLFSQSLNVTTSISFILFLFTYKSILRLNSFKASSCNSFDWYQENVVNNSWVFQILFCFGHFSFHFISRVIISICAENNVGEIVCLCLSSFPIFITFVSPIHGTILIVFFSQ